MSMAASSGGAQPASRTWIAAGFTLATIFSGLVTLGVGVYSADHQARLADRTAQVNQFVEAARGFDPLAVKFVAEIRKGQLTDETRRSIKANLVQQRSTLESAESLLSAPEQDLAERYSQALVDADQGLKTATGPMNSRSFAQAAVDVATIRPQLYKALRN